MNGRLTSDFQSYYNESEDYVLLMQEHGADYFATYISLVAQYSDEADKLLDLGCGAGMSTSLLAEALPAVQCTGLDISEQSISFARSRHTLPNLRFEVGNCASLPYPDGSFDIVAAYDCLEHIPYPMGVLTELMRVTSAGGRIIIKGPNHMSPLFTLIDLSTLKHNYPFTRNWLHNFPRLMFEVGHILYGKTTGRTNFVSIIPDLTDAVQVGNDADAVTDMCNIDVVNFFRASGWHIERISWPRSSGTLGRLISTYFPLCGSMGVVARKPPQAAARSA